MQKKYDRVYVIDCENVGFTFYTSPNDLVYYFTNSSVKELPFICNKNEIHMCLNHTGCKDALDFIIDTFLGYLVRNYGRNTEYFIISNDKGYNNVSAFWQGLGYKVYTNPHNSLKPLNKENTALKGYISTINNAKKILDKLPNEYEEKINNILASWIRSKSKNKAVLLKELERCLHNRITKKEIKELCNYYYDNVIGNV